MTEKKHRRPKGRISYCRTWRRAYHWGLNKDSVTEDPKENPINKRTPSLWNIKTALAMKSLKSFRILNDFCVVKKYLFSYLVMVYDRVGDGDKFSCEKFGLGRPCFNVNSHLKIEAKIFCSETLIPQCNSWIPYNCH